jgi:AbrB family looped-hinge helix DNA binding protein
MKGTVSERGQVTIPKRLRDELGISAGQVLDFVVEGGRLVATKTAQRDPVEAVYGVLGERSSTDDTITALRGEPDAV